MSKHDDFVWPFYVDARFQKLATFCSAECSLQGSGELSVGWMIDAWTYATTLEAGAVPNVTTIIKIGRRVEPYVNNVGLRRHNVMVGGSRPPDWEHVPTLLGAFVREPMTSPEAWFREYEEIHPFGDGNGRSGAILYNLLCDTLRDPVWPPNCFNDPRRVPGFGAPER